MMLKGQAKTDYQRNYMRVYRLKKQVVRPSEMKPVRPTDKDILIARDYLDNADVPDDLGLPPGVSFIDADGNMVYD